MLQSWEKEYAVHKAQRDVVTASLKTYEKNFVKSKIIKSPRTNKKVFSDGGLLSYTRLALKWLHMIPYRL